MGKKLMKGKTVRSKGKKMSHGNSHASPDEVYWNAKEKRWRVKNGT